MYSKKGKRKIIVNDKLYYWCITVDKDTGIEPIILSVFSEEKYLFGRQYLYESKRWERYEEPNPYDSHKLILGEAPQIKPSTVSKLILDYLSQ